MSQRVLPWLSPSLELFVPYFFASHWEEPPEDAVLNLSYPAPDKGGGFHPSIHP